MLVPVKLALHDAKAHDAVVHLAQGLVVPGIAACLNQWLEFNQFERRKFRIQMDGIWGLARHEDSPFCNAPILTPPGRANLGRRNRPAREALRFARRSRALRLTGSMPVM